MLRRFPNSLALLLIVNLCAPILAFPNEVTAKTLEDLVSENELSILPHFKVGEKPNAVAIGPLGFVYVSNRDSQSVSVIDSNTMKVFDLRVQNDPSDIAIDSGWVYVANTGSDSVSVINGINNTVAGRIPVGNAPVDIALGNDKVYVVNAGSNDVSVINSSSNKEIARIPVGDNPMDIYSIIQGNKSELYVTNHDSSDVSAINGSTDKEIARIPVGKWPVAINVDGLIEPNVGNVYVVNNDGSGIKNDSVSVIDKATNTEIRRIPVGRDASDIHVGIKYIYVSNSGSDSLSVINRSNYNEIETIPVGIFPEQIASDLYGKDKLDKLYVINQGYVTKHVISDVSVIDTSSNKEIARIPVGKWPNDIAIDGDTAYVTNFDSNSVTVFDGRSLEVQTGISFDVKPSDAGSVICNNFTVPTNVHFYLDYSSSCAVESNKGFQFTGWTEALGPNSSRTVSNPGSSVPFWDQVPINLGLETKDTLSDLNVTSFGNFVATFEELPPPIPREYLIGLYTLVVSSIIGYSIPSIINWSKFKMQGRRMSRFHQRIDDNKIEGLDIVTLEGLRKEIRNDYSKGNISDQQYENMKNEISLPYMEIFNKRIDSMHKIENKENTNKLFDIASEITNAYANGELNELHYNLLNEKISDIKNNQNPPAT